MKIMITIEAPNTETRTIPAERLRTMTQYAKQYKKEDGKIGCTPVYIKNLVDLGKLDTIRISGQVFVVLNDEEMERAGKAK